MRWDQLENILQRAMKPMKDRLLLMVGRAVIKAVNNSPNVQELQLAALAGESIDKVQNFQQFGFVSNPPIGSEGIMVALGSNRENCVVIATENRKVRFKNTAPGESAIYTDDGTHIHLKKAGQVEIKTATKVTIDAPLSQFTGDVIVDKTLLVKKATTLQDTLLVQKDATFMMNIIVTLNAQVTALVQAGGYSGPAGGGPSAPVVINVPVTLGASAPVTSGADINAINVVASGNVTGGGTNMATIKSTFNAHTHPETGTTTTPTGTPL